MPEKVRKRGCVKIINADIKRCYTLDPLYLLRKLCKLFKTFEVPRNF